MSASVKDKDGHTVDVIVYDDTSGAYGPAGHVIYHDKPTDVIPGIIEQVGTIIVDILATIPGPDVVFAPLATALSLAEAGQGFAEGNVLGGILQIADAAGFAYQAYGVDFGGGSAAVRTGQLVLAASAAVGGASSVVQSAEAGDPLGAVAGALTVAAAAASAGVTVGGISGDQQVLNLGNVQVDGATLKLSLDVTEALGAAAAGTAVADALNRGDVNSALITSLGPLLTAIAQNVSLDDALGKASTVGQLAANGKSGTRTDAPYYGPNSIFIPYSPANESFATETINFLSNIGNGLSDAAEALINIVFNSASKPDTTAQQPYIDNPGLLEGQSPADVESQLDEKLVAQGNWVKSPSKDGNGIRYIDGKGGSVIINNGYPEGLATGQGDAVHLGPYVKISGAGLRQPLRIPLK